MEVKESQLKISWTYENKEMQNCLNMQETYNPENNCQRQKRKEDMWVLTAQPTIITMAVQRMRPCQLYHLM